MRSTGHYGLENHRKRKRSTDDNYYNSIFPMRCKASDNCNADGSTFRRSVVGCAQCVFSWHCCNNNIRYYAEKDKTFSGDPAPFVMELPAYHMPTMGNVMRSVWERGWSFIKKAGTIILLSSIIIWLLNHIGWNNYSFG